MIFTTNKPLSEWGKVLHDEDLAAAILDRVLERGRFIQLDGPSGRTRHLNLDEVWPATEERLRISGINGSKFPEPTGVDFDVQNEAVIIHSTTVLTGDEWKRVQDIGMEKIQSIVPCTSPIRIRQLRRPTFAYTFHGPPDAMRKRVRKAEVTEFSLELSAINSLAEAYAELIKRSKDFDVVVGFALGGSACVKFCHRI